MSGGKANSNCTVITAEVIVQLHANYTLDALAMSLDIDINMNIDIDINMNIDIDINMGIDIDIDLGIHMCPACIFVQDGVMFDCTVTFFCLLLFVVVWSLLVVFY